MEPKQTHHGAKRKAWILTRTYLVPVLIVVVTMLAITLTPSSEIWNRIGTVAAILALLEWIRRHGRTRSKRKP